MTWKHPAHRSRGNSKHDRLLESSCSQHFGTLGDQYLSITQNWDQQWTVTDIMKCCVTIFGQRFESNAVDYCRKVSSYSTTTHVLIRLLKLLVNSPRSPIPGSWTSSIQSWPCPFRFSPLQTPKRSFARTAVFNWRGSEGRGAWMVAFHAEIILLRRYSEACSSMDQMCWMRRRLCWKLKLSFLFKYVIKWWLEQKCK